MKKIFANKPLPTDRTRHLTAPEMIALRKEGFRVNAGTLVYPDGKVGNKNGRMVEGVSIVPKVVDTLMG